MRYLLVLVIALHGLLHFLGFAKAYGLAELPELAEPIGRGLGLVWLVAGLLLLTTAGLIATSRRGWWLLGLVAAVASQVAIGSSWSDAAFGTAVNLVLLAASIYQLAWVGPISLRAEYDRAVRTRRPRTAPTTVLSEEDLGRLPEPVRRFVRQSGAVGRPRVARVRARWCGRIRAKAADPWMPFVAEQTNFPAEPARFFKLDARRAGLPVDVYHAFEHEAASMRVRLLSLIPLVRARGADLTRTETVTLLNDLCLLTPGELVDPRIRWEAIDDHAVLASYTVGANTVSARLQFGADGELLDFVSEDRGIVSDDGARFTPLRWSTPLTDYRRLGGWRVPTRGEGRWHPPEGSFTYIELELIDLEVDP